MKYNLEDGVRESDPNVIKRFTKLHWWVMNVNVNYIGFDKWVLEHIYMPNTIMYPPFTDMLNCIEYN